MLHVPAIGQSLAARAETARTRSLAVASDARVRGQAFRSLLAALSSVSVDVEAVVQRLPADVATLLNGDVRGTGWYPVASYGLLHQAALDVTGKPTSFSREIGQQAKRLDGRGVFQFVLRFVSPESLIRHADRVLGLYVDGPMIDVSLIADAAGKRRARVHITNAAGYTEPIWQDHYGSMEAMVALSGGRNPEAVEIDRGDEWSICELSWL